MVSDWTHPTTLPTNFRRIQSHPIAVHRKSRFSGLGLNFARKTVLARLFSLPVSEANSAATWQQFALSIMGDLLITGVLHRPRGDGEEDRVCS